VLDPVGMVEDIESLEHAARLLGSRAAWRTGATAAAAVVAVLALAGALEPAAAALGVVVAVTIAVTAHLAREMRLEEWAARDDLAALPELARARRRLVGDARRREVAGSLRRIAAQRRTSRHDVAPLLVRRLAPVRDDLLAVAEEVERAPALQPGTMVEITRLITDGVKSPLLNEAVPEGELALLLRRIRFELATARDGVRPAT
jgi:hypothetical protein